MERLNPFRRVSSKGNVRDGINQQVARRQDFLLGQIHDGISRRMAPSQVPHLHFPVPNIDIQLINEGEGGRLINQSLEVRSVLFHTG
jgi:hypothetical protein